MPIHRLVAALLAVVHLTASSAGADPDSRVRASNQRLAGLLAAAEHRSATFRNLVRRLHASDVIVHLETAPPGYPIDAGLQFVSSTAFARYLRATVRPDLPPIELMALMGHELRHAVEVAESPGIRDQSSFRDYYEQRGRPTYRGRTVTYDTQAAVDAGLRVAIELRAAATTWSRAFE